MKLPKFKLSIFAKIMITLSLILLIEIFLIYKGYFNYKYKNSSNWWQDTLPSTIRLRIV